MSNATKTVRLYSVQGSTLNPATGKRGPSASFIVVGPNGIEKMITILNSKWVRAAWDAKRTSDDTAEEKCDWSVTPKVIRNVATPSAVNVTLGRFQPGDLVRVASGNVYRVQDSATVRTEQEGITYGLVQIRNGKRFGPYRRIAEHKLTKAQ